MVPTANFRRQHEELMHLGMAILQQVRSPDFVTHLSDVRRRLATFSGKLTVHASMEGEALYPRLLSQDDLPTRALAQRFVDEVGGLYDAFFAFVRKWPDCASIERDPTTFARETKQVFRVLAERMMRETSELYPLVDELG